MKTAKINYPMALLLLIAILAPLTAYGGPRDAAVARPIDDQPWGGEINNDGYKDTNINSIGYDPYPSDFEIITIRNIGTPMVLFDYLRFFIFDYTVTAGNSSSVNQVNVATVPESKTYAPSPIRDKRFSIRKGR